MATRSIVPRANDEGSIGTSAKKWNYGYFTNISADNYIGVHAGANKRIVSPNMMRLDDTNTGSDQDTVFNIIDSVSFNTTTDGSVWCTIDFNDSDFDTSTDITVDLIHVFDGDASDTEAVHLTIDCWVVDTGEAPVTSSPDVTQTRDLSVDSTTDNTIQEYTTFMTIGSLNLNSNTRTISFKITREPGNANDTYGGSYHIVKLIAKQS